MNELYREKLVNTDYRPAEVYRRDYALVLNGWDSTVSILAALLL